MTKENLKRKHLYEMLAKIAGKDNTYAIRMYFFRNGLNVLDPTDFMSYADTARKKRKA